MKLVQDARQAWRMWSVQAAALLVVWGSLPLDLQTAIVSAIGVPAERVSAVLGLLVIVGRLIQQPALQPKPVE